MIVYYYKSRQIGWLEMLFECPHSSFLFLSFFFIDTNEQQFSWRKGMSSLSLLHSLVNVTRAFDCLKQIESLTWTLVLLWALFKKILNQLIFLSNWCHVCLALIGQFSVFDLCLNAVGPIYDSKPIGLLYFIGPRTLSFI